MEPLQRGPRGCVQWQLIQARLTDCDRSGHAEKKTAPAPLVVGGLHTGAVSFAIQDKSGPTTQTTR